MLIMKNGEAVPPALFEALEGDAYASEVFARMRPSCQKRYARHVLEAKSEEVAHRRAHAVLVQIRAYGEKHKL